jgi:trehalose 6-phosphate phosphatase
VLEQLAWSNVLLGFDYDGTLAPIVPDPGLAGLRPRTRLLLRRVAALYPCVVISGRAHRDVRHRLEGTGIREVIGNHGIEPWRSSRRIRETVAGWQPILRDRLGSLCGLAIEDKTFSIAVHYRRSREKQKARAAILEVASSLGAARVIGGRLVINLVPEGAPHKGIALEAVRRRLGCDTALYVGDDETDEDVFALEVPGRLLGIRVGAKRTSLASYCVRSQKQVDELLELLIEARYGAI